jgi:hypothetical protein
MAQLLMEPESTLTPTATVAAPLLAGFSFALIGVVLQIQTNDADWQALVLLLLLLAGMLLIVTVQSMLWYRAYHSRPFAQLMWDMVARIAYDLGVLLLLTGVATLLVTENPSGLRDVVVAIAYLGVIGEAVWILASWTCKGARQVNSERIYRAVLGDDATYDAIKAVQTAGAWKAIRKRVRKGESLQVGDFP